MEDFSITYGQLHQKHKTYATTIWTPMDAKMPESAVWTPRGHQTDTTRSGLLIAFTRGRHRHVDSLLPRESSLALHDATRQHFGGVGGHFPAAADVVAISTVLNVNATRYSFNASVDRARAANFAPSLNSLATNMPRTGFPPASSRCTQPM